MAGLTVKKGILAKKLEAQKSGRLLFELKSKKYDTMSFKLVIGNFIAKSVP